MNPAASIYTTRFCALDIETTGINPYSDRIIEIGISAFTIDGESETYQTLINPERHIPEQVTSIHGITDDMVADAPACASVLPDVIAFVKSSPLVIHNSRFDLSFLEMECRRAQIKLPSWVSYDTVILSRKSFPEIVNHKLDTLCRYFAVSLEHHRGLQDAVGCMEIFRHCIRHADPSKRWTFADLNTFSGGTESAGFIRELAFKERRGGRITVGKEAVIRYIDGEGNVTERRILPKTIYKKGKQTVIFAFCFLRNEDRYFKSNRIDEVLESK
jgi:DNA polymerase III epsilon subunit family exonuclease